MATATTTTDETNLFAVEHVGINARRDLPSLTSTLPSPLLFIPSPLRMLSHQSTTANSTTACGGGGQVLAKLECLTQPTGSLFDRGVSAILSAAQARGDLSQPYGTNTTLVGAAVAGGTEFAVSLACIGVAFGYANVVIFLPESARISTTQVEGVISAYGARVVVVPTTTTTTTTTTTGNSDESECGVVERVRQQAEEYVRTHNEKEVLVVEKEQDGGDSLQSEEEVDIIESSEPLTTTTMASGFCSNYYYLVEESRDPVAVDAAYARVAAEIWVDTHGLVELVVIGFEYAVAAAGLARALARLCQGRPEVCKVVLVQNAKFSSTSSSTSPSSSPNRSSRSRGSYSPSPCGFGLDLDLEDLNLDPDLLSEVYYVHPSQAAEVAYSCPRQLGLRLSVSSAATLYAATELAKKPAHESKLIVAICSGRPN